MSTPTAMIRARQSVLLLRPMSRGALSWTPLAGAALAALLVHVLARVLDQYEPLTNLRHTSLLLAAGAAFAFDDDASQTIDPSPAPLPFRRAYRASLAMAGVSIAAASMLALTASARDGALDGILGRFVVELAAMTTVALLASAIGARTSHDRRGGLAGAGALLFVCVGAMVLPPRWATFVTPDSLRWHDAGRDVALTAIFAAIGVAGLSLDPARQRIRITRRPAALAAASGRNTQAAQEGGSTR